MCELLDGLRANDQTAWATFTRRYQDRLTNFAAQRVGADAEDVVQETFIGFMSTLDRYDGSRSLDSWLWSILVHKITDRLRKQGRQINAASLHGDDGGEDTVLDVPDHRCEMPDEIVAENECLDAEREALAEAVRLVIGRWSRANPTKVMAVEMMVVEGQPNQDVARRLGLSDERVAGYKFEFARNTGAAVKRMAADPGCDARRRDWKEFREIVGTALAAARDEARGELRQECLIPDSCDGDGVDSSESSSAVAECTTAKTKRISAINAAAKVLDEFGVMSTQQMIEAMAANGYWTSPAGKTPHATLYAELLREIKTKGIAARFRRVGPNQFVLAGERQHRLAF